MKNTNKPLKMKWYNYLVYFWLPLNILLGLINLVVLGKMFSPVIVALFSSDLKIPSENKIDLFALLYILLFMCIIPFFYTLALRRSLKKFKHCAPKLVSFWYVLSALTFAGFFVFLLIRVDVSTELVYLLVFLILRALIAVPNNALYFYKRSALFAKPPKKISMRKAKRQAKKQAKKARKKAREDASFEEYFEEDYEETFEQ